MPAIEPRPRGADGIILGVITEHAENGRACLSLVDLAALSGYTVPTVQAAVRRLEACRYVVRSQPCPRRPTEYELVSAQLRRAIIAGELVGLIAPTGSL